MTCAHSLLLLALVTVVSTKQQNPLMSQRWAGGLGPSLTRLALCSVCARHLKYLALTCSGGKVLDPARPLINPMPMAL